MSTLRDLQQAFARAIFEPHPVLAAPPQTHVHSALLAVPPGAELGERLGIHRNGLPARVHDALREAHPATAHILGAATFAETVARFISLRPLRTANLNHVGETFPAFLRDDAISERLPFVADLARLEHAVQHAFHAQAVAPITSATLTDLHDIDWSRAVLRFQPAVAVVESSWPVLDLWQARDTPREAIDIELIGRAQAVVVHRVEFSVHCEILDAPQARALGMCLAAKPFGEMIAAVADSGVDGTRVASWTNRWMRAGWITGVRIVPW